MFKKKYSQVSLLSFTYLLTRAVLVFVEHKFRLNHYFIMDLNSLILRKCKNDVSMNIDPFSKKYETLRFFATLPSFNHNNGYQMKHKVYLFVKHGI